MKKIKKLKSVARARARPSCKSRQKLLVQIVCLCALGVPLVCPPPDACARRVHWIKVILITGLVKGLRSAIRFSQIPDLPLLFSARGRERERETILSLIHTLEI